MRRRKFSEWRSVSSRAAAGNGAQFDEQRAANDEGAIASPWQTGSWRINPAQISVFSPARRRSDQPYSNNDDMVIGGTTPGAITPLRLMTYSLCASSFVLGVAVIALLIR